MNKLINKNMVNQNENKNVNDYSSIRRVFHKNGQKLKFLTLWIKPEHASGKFFVSIEGLEDSVEIFNTVMYKRVKDTRKCLYGTIAQSFVLETAIFGFESKYQETAFFDSLEESEIVASKWLQSYRVFLDTGEFHNFEGIQNYEKDPPNQKKMPLDIPKDNSYTEASS